LADLVQKASIDRRHRDGAHLVVALDAELDEIAGAPGPELLVELLLRGHGHTVDLQDAVALPEPGARGRPDRRELAHEEAGRHRDRVEAGPRARRAARAAPRLDTPVLRRDELLR